MAAPSTAILRLDYSLSYGQFNLEMNRKGYCGLKVFPAIPVDFQSAQFRKMKIANILRPIQDTRRGEKGNYKKVDFTWTKDTYATEDHGLEHDLDDREVKKYKDMLNQEILAAMVIQDGIMQDFEQHAASLAQDTAQLPTSAVTNKWSDHTNGTPVDDLITAAQAIQNATGIPISQMTATITDLALTDARRCQSVISQVKYDGQHNAEIPQSAIIGILCGMTGLKGINVASGFCNTGGEDAGGDEVNATPTRLWDPNRVSVHVCSNAMGQLEAPIPRIGNTLQWKDEAAMPISEEEISMYIEEYRNEGVRGGTMRGRNDWALKLLQAECGYVLTNIR